ncbi:di-heme oxidoredictase family protein [Pseudophaeobacter sp.]|uniref:di-heme oxidoreductase family protein n=1 Tax=Pseudophaeobacter sp. TaxID=1971739 RepID=UPI003A972723
MHSSTPPKWKRSKSNLLVATALVVATSFAGLAPACAGEPTFELSSIPLSDPHLNSLPRSAVEQARIAAVTAPTQNFTAPEAFEARPVGSATVPARGDTTAFSQHGANLSFEQELAFKLGNGLFKKIWVFSPASTLASDGLGPLYNARSCQRCHIKDGRGQVPTDPDYRAASMFLRVSIPAPPPAQMRAVRDYIGTAPDPNYGGQLQDFSRPGVPSEYRLQVSYTPQTLALSGGESVTLRRPTYTAAALGYGPLHPDAMLSPRLAPPMIGLGLIEAISTADILANVDELDADGDGISGRANLAWSAEYDQIMLGRFGQKAGMPTLHQQSAAAFSGDIGISTPLFDAAAGDCTAAQTGCLAAPHGDGDIRGTEIDQANMDLVTFYARNLAVPARRDLDDPQVLRGKALFYGSGCTGCHQPKFVTQRLTDRPENSFQLIWPYSDFLLHDMGPDLADNRPEGRATGREWRTPPLWGIGLTRQVNPDATYLHDGRARSLLEAVLWHGGEAEPARNRVIALAPADRAALLRFLESL